MDTYIDENPTIFFDGDPDEGNLDFYSLKILGVQIPITLELDEALHKHFGSWSIQERIKDERRSRQADHAERQHDAMREQAA